MTNSYESVYRTETHTIKRGHPAFTTIDDLAFKSKNIYNSVLYLNRQVKFHNQKVGDGDFQFYPTAFGLCKDEDVKPLMRDLGFMKVAQGSIQYAQGAFDSFRKAETAYFRGGEGFTGKPKMPKYKDKIYGRAPVIFNPQTLSKPFLKKGQIKLSGIDHVFNFYAAGESRTIKQVMFVPYNKDTYRMFIQYEKVIEIKPIHDEYDEVHKAGLDLGLNKTCAIATTTGKGFLVDGAQLKHINKKYNILIDTEKSKLPVGVYTSKRIKRLYKNRSNKIKYLMHKMSKSVVDTLVANHVGYLKIGHNKGWKSEINLGRATNRKFVEVPFNTLIHMLEYKGVERGLSVSITEEAYTSKASALDKDQLFKFGSKPKDYKFSGHRKIRGLYVSKDGKHLHADVNGAFNILRKNDPSVDCLKDYPTLVIGCAVRPEHIQVNLA